MARTDKDKLSYTNGCSCLNINKLKYKPEVKNLYVWSEKDIIGVLTTTKKKLPKRLVINDVVYEQVKRTYTETEE